MVRACYRQDAAGAEDRRNLARFSFLIPFWALSSGFLRVARQPAGTRFFDELLGDYALVELVQNQSPGCSMFVLS